MSIFDEDNNAFYISPRFLLCALAFFGLMWLKEKPKNSVQAFAPQPIPAAIGISSLPQGAYEVTDARDEGSASSDGELRTFIYSMREAGGKTIIVRASAPESMKYLKGARIRVEQDGRIIVQHE